MIEVRLVLLVISGPTCGFVLCVYLCVHMSVSVHDSPGNG